MQQQTTRRAHNFNAGPSALPLAVLEKAQQELVDFRGTGMSVMELSHRSAAFDSVHNQAIALLRELLSIPNNYEVLFLQGGASLQFSMIPMNLLQPGKKAAYAVTGVWAEKAFIEAELVGDAYLAASTAEGNHKRIPSLDELKYDASDAYLHITTSNTIYGTQWKEFPRTGNVPLIADMSSDILSQPIDVSQFGLIYAGAQKNLGPSGVTIVIIRKDLIENANKSLPTMLRYSTFSESNSLYNTPPTFGIYMLGEVLQWAKEQGGVDVLAKRNAEKTALIYHAIDEGEGFYLGHAERDSRSLMNITFRLKTKELEDKFIKVAEQEGFIGVAGHRIAGGCRVSTYNSVPYESCKAFSEFMTDFRKKHE